MWSSASRSGKNGQFLVRLNGFQKETLRAQTPTAPRWKAHIETCQETRRKVVSGRVRLSARANAPSSSAAVAQRATRDLRQRPGGTPARALVRNAAVPSGGAIGVGRAAAAWLHARIGARCPMHPVRVWATRAHTACLPRATGSIFGMNSGETQRAVELAAADPANRARLGPRRELGERRRPKELPRRAAFEHEPERAAARGLSGARTRDDPVRCTAARRRSKGNTPAAQHPSTQHPVFNTLMSPFSFFCLRAPPTSVRTSHPQTSDSGLSATSGARQFHPLHISQSPHSDTHAAQTLTPHLIGARAQGVKYRDAGEGSRCCGLRSQRPKLSEERSRSRPGAPACASA